MLVQHDQDNVSKIVRQIRKSFLSQIKGLNCQDSNILFPDSYIKDNIDVVEEELKLNTTYSINKDVSDETLQVAVDLFTYLNFCPTPEFRTLSSIVKHLANSKSAKNILLALTSIMKTSKNAVNNSSAKIFIKAMEIFGLINYKDIDAITKEKGFDDLKYYNETLKVLGKKIHESNSTITNVRSFILKTCFILHPTLRDFNAFQLVRITVILGSIEAQRTTNHPVHIKHQSGNLSPTALIPFCEFGGNMSVMGVKIDQFDVPVCNSFRSKIIRDQLCYTVDPNDYKHKIDLEKDISISLFINYNEDREINSDTATENYVIRIETIGNLLRRTEIIDKNQNTL